MKGTRSCRSSPEFPGDPMARSIRRLSVQRRLTSASWMGIRPHNPQTSGDHRRLLDVRLAQKTGRPSVMFTNAGSV